MPPTWLVVTVADVGGVSLFVVALLLGALLFPLEDLNTEPLVEGDSRRLTEFYPEPLPHRAGPGD